MPIGALSHSHSHAAAAGLRLIPSAGHCHLLTSSCCLQLRSVLGDIVFLPLKQGRERRGGKCGSYGQVSWLQIQPVGSVPGEKLGECFVNKCFYLKQKHLAQNLMDFACGSGCCELPKFHTTQQVMVPACPTASVGSAVCRTALVLVRRLLAAVTWQLKCRRPAGRAGQAHCAASRRASVSPSIPGAAPKSACGLQPLGLPDQVPESR